MSGNTEKTRKETVPIKVYVTPQEKDQIISNANLYSLSASNYLRNLGLGFSVTPTIDQEAVSALAKLNADQGRLGGLLKMFLSNDEKLRKFNEANLIQGIEECLNQIYSIQETLYYKVSKL